MVTGDVPIRGVLADGCPYELAGGAARPFSGCSRRGRVAVYPAGSLIISTKHDIPLLRQVRDSLFVTQQQLYELLVLSGVVCCRFEVFSRRLRKLVRAGNINCVQAVAWQHSPVYSIASKGLMELESQGEFAIAFHSGTKHMPSRHQLFHALELNQIRIALARTTKRVDWQSEIEIASTNMVSPSPYQKDYDAVVKLSIEGRTIDFALEYERSLKSASRYAKIKVALEGERKVSSVVYVAASRDLMLALLYQLTPASIPIAFGTASSFREYGVATEVSIDASGGSCTLRSFLKYVSLLRGG